MFWRNTHTHTPSGFPCCEMHSVAQCSFRKLGGAHAAEHCSLAGGPAKFRPGPARFGPASTTFGPESAEFGLTSTKSEPPSNVFEPTCPNWDQIWANFCRCRPMLVRCWPDSGPLRPTVADFDAIWAVFDNLGDVLASVRRFRLNLGRFRPTLGRFRLNLGRARPNLVGSDKIWATFVQPRRSSGRIFTNVDRIVTELRDFWWARKDHRSGRISVAQTLKRPNFWGREGPSSASSGHAGGTAICD